MNFGVRIEIDFHQQDEASIFLETTAPEEDAKFAELLIFCLMAARQMFNLSCGGDPGGSAKSLAYALTKAHDMILPAIYSIAPNAAKLIAYAGSPGRKRFVGRLTFSETNFNFQMDAKGFGILGRGVAYYAPISVVLLLEYLGKRRLNDQKYLNSLLGAAVACGEAFLMNKITLQSQHKVAAEIAATYWALMTKEQDELVSLKQSAEKGDANAQFQLGRKYDSGEGVPQDYSEAAKWYLKAAEQGHLDAQYTIACLYREGLGVTQDYSKAVRWFTNAAEKGHAPSQTNLGMMYIEGLGVEKDFSKAFVLTRKAATSGVAWAQTNLGIMYEKGDGITQNYGTASEWYRKAAEQGNPEAQNRLGRLYATGKGLPADNKAALAWYQVAANNGHKFAQFNLGDMYMRGIGVPQDVEKAAQWFYQAATQGLVDAQIHMAMICEVFLNNVDKAKEWYLKAAAQGDEKSAKRLRELS